MIFNLASAVVDLVIKNGPQAKATLREVENQVKSLNRTSKQNEKETTSAFQRISKSISSVGSTVISVSEKIRNFAAGASGAILGLVGVSLRGTAEGHNLALAFQEFARSIGDAFAPAVRLLTSLINGLTTFMKSLGREGKAAIVIMTLFAAGVGIVALGVIFLTKTIIALNVALAALAANPVGATIAAIVAAVAAIAIAIPAALVTVSVATKGWNETLVSMLAILLRIRDVGREAFDGIKIAIEGAQTALKKYTDMLPKGTGKAVQNAILDQVLPGGKFTRELLTPSDKNMQEARDRINSGGLSGRRPSFESLQGTFERVQSNLTGVAPQPATEKAQEQTNQKLDGILTTLKDIAIQRILGPSIPLVGR